MQIAELVSTVPDSDELSEAQDLFCKQYCYDFNATRAYEIAYPKKKANSVIRANASGLLTRPNIQRRIQYLKEHLEESVGLSREMVLREHMKMAFSSIAHLHNTWIERKEFDALTKDQKDCIQEITTQTRTIESEDEGVVTIDFVKIRLYDKQKALDSISKMVGYDAAIKVETKNFNINVEVTAEEARKILAGIEKQI